LNPRIGDIMAFSPRGLGWLLCPLSLAIKLVQRCEVTHTAILVDSTRMIVVEGWWPKARYRAITPGRWHEWRTYRPSEAVATETQRQTAAWHAEKMVGMPYDTQSIFDLARWFFWERVLGVRVRDRVRVRDDEGKVYCQELITAAYDKAGVSFADRLGFKDPSAVTPRDVALRPDVFDRVV
jgi:hypothetical protein